MKRTLKVLAVVLVVAMLAVAGVITAVFAEDSTSVTLYNSKGAGGWVELKTYDSLEAAVAGIAAINTANRDPDTDIKVAKLVLGDAYVGNGKVFDLSAQDIGDIDLTIDLNGKTYSVDAYNGDTEQEVAINVPAGVKLTILNGAIAGEIVEKDTNQILDGEFIKEYKGVKTLIQTRGTLTLQNVTLNGLAKSDSVIDVQAGTVKATGATRIIAADAASIAVKLASGATLDTTGLTTSIVEEAVVDAASGKVLGKIDYNGSDATIKTGNAGLYDVTINVEESIAANVKGAYFHFGTASTPANTRIVCTPETATDPNPLVALEWVAAQGEDATSGFAWAIAPKTTLSEGSATDVAIKGLGYKYTHGASTVVITKNETADTGWAATWVLADTTGTPTVDNGIATVELSFTTGLTGRVVVEHVATGVTKYYIVDVVGGKATVHATDLVAGTWSIKAAGDELVVPKDYTVSGTDAKGNAYSFKNTYSAALTFGYYGGNDGRYALGVYTVTTDDIKVYYDGAKFEYADYISSVTRDWQRYKANNLDFIADVVYTDAQYSYVPEDNGAETKYNNAPTLTVKLGDIDFVAANMVITRDNFAAAKQIIVEGVTVPADIKLSDIVKVFDNRDVVPVLNKLSIADYHDTTNGVTVVAKILDTKTNTYTLDPATVTYKDVATKEVSYQLSAKYYKTVTPKFNVAITPYNIENLTVTAADSAFVSGQTIVANLSFTALNGLNIEEVLYDEKTGEYVKGHFEFVTYEGADLPSNKSVTSSYVKDEGTGVWVEGKKIITIKATAGYGNFTGEKKIEWLITRQDNVAVDTLADHWGLTATADTPTAAIDAKWGFGMTFDAAENGYYLRAWNTNAIPIYYEKGAISFRVATNRQANPDYVQGTDPACDEYIYEWGEPTTTLPTECGKYYISFRIEDTQSHSGYAEDVWSWPVEHEIEKGMMSWTDAEKVAGKNVESEYKKEVIFNAQEQAWLATDFVKYFGSKTQLKADPIDYSVANNAEKIAATTAGSVNVTVTYKFENYQDIDVKYTLVIKPLEIDLVMGYTNDGKTMQLQYSGKAQPAPYSVFRAGTTELLGEAFDDYSVFGTAQGAQEDAVISSFTKPSDTIAPGNNSFVTNLLKYDNGQYIIDTDVVSPNYVIKKYQAGRVEIVPREVKITLANGLSEIYNGSEYIWTPAVVGSYEQYAGEGDTIKIDEVATQISGKDAMEEAMDITEAMIKLVCKDTNGNDVSDCYEVVLNNTVTFQINKRAITIDLGDYTVPFGSDLAYVEKIFAELTKDADYDINDLVDISDGKLGLAPSQSIAKIKKGTLPTLNYTAEKYGTANAKYGIQIMQGALDVTDNYVITFVDCITINVKHFGPNDTITIVWADANEKFVFNGADQYPTISKVYINDKLIENFVATWETVTDAKNAGVKNYGFTFTADGYTFTADDYNGYMAEIKNSTITAEDEAEFEGLTDEDIEAMIKDLEDEEAAALQAKWMAYKNLIDARKIDEMLSFSYEILPKNINITAFPSATGSYGWSETPPIEDFYFDYEGYKILLNWGAEVGHFYGYPVAVVDAETLAIDKNYTVSYRSWFEYDIVPVKVTSEKFVQLNATIGKTYGLIFTVDATFIDMYGKDYTVDFIRDGVVVKRYEGADALVKNSDGYYIFTYNNIAPDAINTEITAVLYVDGVERDRQVYSIATFCYKSLAIFKDVNNIWCKAYIALLYYGDAAQIYNATLNDVDVTTEEFKKSLATYELKNNSIYEIYKDFVPEKVTMDPAKSYKVETPYTGKIESYANVIMNNGVAIQYSFKFTNLDLKETDVVKVTLDGHDYTVDGEDYTLTYDEKTGLYSVNAKLSLVDVSADKTFTVKVNTDTVATLTYTIEAYAASGAAEISPELVDLIQKLVDLSAILHGLQQS